MRRSARRSTDQTEATEAAPTDTAALAEADEEADLRIEISSPGPIQRPPCTGEGPITHSNGDAGGAGRSSAAADMEKRKKRVVKRNTAPDNRREGDDTLDEGGATAA